MQMQMQMQLLQIQLQCTGCDRLRPRVIGKNCPKLQLCPKCQIVPTTKYQKNRFLAKSKIYHKFECNFFSMFHPETFFLQNRG